MMSRKITGCYIFCIVLIALFSPLQCYAEKPDIPGKIHKITVVSDDNYPPYIFRGPKGALQGILIDEWDLWEKRTGIKVNFIGMDWGKAQRFIKAGKADVIDTMFLTDERTKIFDFTKPYATLEVPVFFHKDISGITDIASLKSFTIGVKEGDACIEVLKKRDITNIVEYASYEEIVKAAADRKIKVFCMDKPPALYYLYRMNLEKDYRHSAPLYTGQFHRAVRKGNKELLTIIEEGFSRISGKEHSDIEKKWIGSALSVNPSTVRRIIYVSIGAVIIVFALMLWNYMLQKRVSMKTSQLETAAEELRENAEKYSALIETTDTGFVILDGKGRVLDANAEYVRLTGHRELEEILGRAVTEWTAEYEKERNAEEVRRCFDKGAVRNLEIDYVDSNGNITPIEINATLVDTKDGPQILTLCRDITKHRELEERLRQSQKMEAVGQLAGGVAHDFNNILSAVMGYASLARMNVENREQLNVFIENILTSAERGANLTHSLLAFSRKQVVNLKTLNINDVIYGVQKMLNRIIGEDVDFKVILTSEELTVTADKSQLEQVLMNLAANARDAMPHGGTLAISTEKAEIDSQFINKYHYGEAGRYALIKVSDTGAGIDEKTKEHIFEPFFTTKEAGKGTGLGLAMVYGTIKQHNGFINVYSEPGEGTVFRIYLPLVELIKEDEQQKEELPPPLGNETIILAEDDEMVRHATRATIEKFGYKVIEALDGEDVVRKFTTNEDTIHLVISDVIMPKKSGRDVYEAVRKIKPDIKFIFISGYTGDVINKIGGLDKGTAFVSKPFKSDTLLWKIRNILDS